MGGKDKNLKILKSNGFNVPSFITVDQNIEKKTLSELIEKELKSNFFAVRSSANVEDGTKTSFAGHFYSAVGVSPENVYNEYLNVVKSFGEHSGNIIIQDFIPSEKSGVIFTNAGDNKVLINANYGLCKTVVEGEPCDEYVFSNDKMLISKYIEKNKKPLFFSDNLFSNDKIFDSEVLNNSEINVLIDKALEIEKLFKYPQDIEWCFFKDKLYILQSRPITQEIFQKKDIIYYDSANIAESYSGIVKPLTLSFAENIYKVVYFNLLKASGASKKKLLKYMEIFDNMTASFYGRLYYNMNNWYLMMKFIPGYDRNKQNLEDMITSNVKQNIADKISPSIGLKIFYPFLVLFKILIFPFSVKSFENKVKHYIKQFRKLNLKQLSLEDCFAKYSELNHNLLSKWHITVENDFLVMSFLGMLKKNMNDEELQKYISFDNKSAKQVEKLKNLVVELNKYPDLKEAIKTENTSKFQKIIETNSDVSNLLNEYFEQYGGRFANELKLESADIEEDKSKLLKLFKLYENFSSAEKFKLPLKHKSIKVRYALNKFKKYASKREELRLLRSNTFSVVRKILNRIGECFVEKNLILETADIYFLKLSEIFDYKNIKNNTVFKTEIEKRKNEYLSFQNINPLPFFGISKNEEVPLKEYITSNSKTVSGRPCTPGKIKGKVKVFKEYFIPETIDFDILIAKHTDPGWTTLIGLSKGMIIEQGGILSHAAIVSRELGIPTIIGVENAVEFFQDNQIIEIDGNTGKIEIL